MGTGLSSGGPHSAGTEEGLPPGLPEAAAVPHWLCNHLLYSEPLMEGEQRRATVSPNSMNLRLTVPLSRGQAPWSSPAHTPASALHSRLPSSWGTFLHNGFGGPAASQADVMANSRRLAHLWDFCA